MKAYKCFVCSLEINELNTIKSHLRIIHNIKDGPYLKLKCCNNIHPCDSQFFSYGSFSKHMLQCINNSFVSLSNRNESIETISHSKNNSNSTLDKKLTSAINFTNSATHASNIVNSFTQPIYVSTECSNSSLPNLNQQGISVNPTLNNSKSVVCPIPTKILKLSSICSENQVIHSNLESTNQNVSVNPTLINSNSISISTECSNSSWPNLNKQSISVNPTLNNSKSVVSPISTKTVNPTPFCSNFENIRPNSVPATNNEDLLLSNIVKLKLPDSVTNEIFSSFTSYINTKSDDLLQFVLANNFSNPQDYKSLVDKVKNQKNSFSKISTTYLRNKKLESGPNYVKPVRIVVNTELKPVLHYRSKLYYKKAKQVTFAYTPILKTLELLLRHDEVRSALATPETHIPGVYKSPSDGTIIMNSEFYKQYPSALKIILYFDEYEAVNPLGSKTGRHKLGALYMTLANLPFHVNSKLKAIQLVAKFNCKFLKSGKLTLNDILKPVFEDVSKLEEGVYLNNELLHGSIFTISADNLGGNSIFGFVECFVALYFCRYCTASKEKCQKMIKEDKNLIRNIDQYLKHYEEFKKQSAVNKKVTHFFGVKGICCFIKLKYYNMFDNMTFDGMHDLLEGLAQYDLKFIGKYMISQKILTLAEINERIESFDYGPINQSNKPSAFKVTKKGHLINQRAAQTWCLLSVFPLIFGDVITSVHKPKFKLITTLIEIAKIIFSPIITTVMINSLRTLIEVHHRIIFNHFRSTLPAKYHFIIHYPFMIERMGPPINYWCMRFEGKHNFFVDLINKIKNYKNLPMTLSNRHQIISYNFWGNSLSKLNELSVGKRKFVDVPSYIVNSLNIENVPLTRIHAVNFLNYNSIKFAPGYFVISNVVKTVPNFNEILYVFDHENEFIFITKKWHTSQYNEKYSAYEIQALDSYEVIYFKNLKHFETFNKIQNYKKNEWFVITKYNFYDKK